MGGDLLGHILMIYPIFQIHDRAQRILVVSLKPVEMHINKPKTPTPQTAGKYSIWGSQAHSQF